MLDSSVHVCECVSVVYTLAEQLASYITMKHFRQ